MAKEKKEINRPSGIVKTLAGNAAETGRNGITSQAYINDQVQTAEKKRNISSDGFTSLSDASRLFLDQVSSSADEPVLPEIDISNVSITTDADLSLLLETVRINGNRKKKANANPASIQPILIQHQSAKFIM